MRDGRRMVTRRQFQLAIIFCLLLIAVFLIPRFWASSLTSGRTSAKIGESETKIQMDQEVAYNKETKIQMDQEVAYNKDLENLRREGHVNIVDLDLTKQSPRELLMTIHLYPDNIQVVCQRKIRMGQIGDGGWELCDDPDVRPRTPCIIYSFGINYDFSFDDDAARVFGCHVYCFDPSMSKYADQVERSNLVHFYKVGLSNAASSEAGKWKMNTFAGIRAMLGHTNKTIHSVKMDIENSEWEALPQMISTGQLDTVKQLMIEYHVGDNSPGYLLPRLQAIQAVERVGFKRYYVHKNPACGRTVPGFPVVRTSCYEVHYIRR